MTAHVCEAGEVILQDETGEEAREVVDVEAAGTVGVAARWEQVVAAVVAAIPVPEAHAPC